MLLIHFYSKEHIHTMQNWYSMITSLFTVYCLYQIYNAETHAIAGNYIQMNLNFIMTYCTVDLLFSTNSSVIYHHFLVIFMCLFLNKYVDYSANVQHISTVLLTEISTIFLILNDYVYGIFIKFPIYPKQVATIASGLNSALFLATFFYTRIYSLFFNLLVDTRPYEYLLTAVENRTHIYAFYVCLHLFLILNVCWLCAIIRIALKHVKEIINKTFHIQQYAIKYMYFANIPITLYVYYTKLETYPTRGILFFKGLYTIWSITCLAISSYFFHNSVYNATIESHKLTDHYHNNANIFCKKVYKDYIFDIFCIHARSFFAVLTHSNFSGMLPLFSAVMHVVLYARFLIQTGLCVGAIHIDMNKWYIPAKMKKRIGEMVGNRYYYNTLDKTCEYKNKNEHIGLHIHISNGLPIVIDTLFVCYLCKDYYWREMLGATTILMVGVMKYQPIYTQTHFLFHMIIWLQTYCLAMIDVWKQ